MAQDTTQEFAREPETLKTASEYSLNNIIRIGRRVRSVTFTKTSPNDWFNGESVPSDPAVFPVLVEMPEAAAQQRGEGRQQRNAPECERLRHQAVGEQRRHREHGRHGRGTARRRRWAGRPGLNGQTHQRPEAKLTGAGHSHQAGRNTRCP
ncbi:hypothetical protein ACIQOW_38985 [Kitasatospora sp. NPDC091335]|uniref:hypothetical protein n=1 Tax=Kitasatospora sp. NPDC091335 TaxID=3364085 RepID=UPI0037F6E916